MTKSINWHSAALSALFLMAAGSALDALSLTGNAETDFVSPEAVIVTDGATPDVGLPPAFPFSTSGWDIKDFRFVYDAEEDALYVGINFFGIAGDADGDGDPASTSAALLSRGGQDLPNLASSEAIQIEFDWNGDGVFDTIAGVPANTPTPPLPKPFLVAPDLSPGTQLPAQSSRFGEPISDLEGFVGAAGAAAPDFEFKIPNASNLPGFNAAGGFEFRAFAGSFQDDGIGEDLPREPCTLIYQLPLPSPWRRRSLR